MRSARFGALAIAALLFCLPLNGCTPTPASAEVRSEDLFAAAVGDNILSTVRFKVAGSPDSVVYSFTVRNAPTLKTTTISPANGVSLATSATLSPVPVMAEGDTATVSACPIAWKKGASFNTFACSTKLFTRPVVPPQVLPDSLTVQQAMLFMRQRSTFNGRTTWAVTTNSTNTICPAFKFKDGMVAIRSSDMDTTIWGCSFNYGTQVAAAQRLNTINFFPTHVVPHAASAARQAIIDTICVTMTADMGGTITPNRWDAACQAAQSSIRREWPRLSDMASVEES